MEYDYLIITALDKEKLKSWSKKEIIKKSGLYDGENFEQKVECPNCGDGMYIEFNDNGIPKYGQCVFCGEISKIHYTDSYIKGWKEGSL